MENVGFYPRWWHAGILILLINGVATTWVGPIMLEEYRTVGNSSRFESLVSREQVEEGLQKAMDSGEKTNWDQFSAPA